MLPGPPESWSDGTLRDGETLAYATPQKPIRNRMLTLFVMIASSGVVLVWAGVLVQVGVAEWRAMRDRVRQERLCELQAQPGAAGSARHHADHVGGGGVGRVGDYVGRVGDYVGRVGDYVGRVGDYTDR